MTDVRPGTGVWRSSLGIRISAAAAVHERTASTNSRQMPPFRAWPDVMTIVYDSKPRARKAPGKTMASRRSQASRTSSTRTETRERKRQAAGRGRNSSAPYENGTCGHHEAAGSLGWYVFLGFCDLSTQLTSFLASAGEQPHYPSFGPGTRSRGMGAAGPS